MKQIFVVILNKFFVSFLHSYDSLKPLATNTMFLYVNFIPYTNKFIVGTTVDHIQITCYFISNY